LQKLQEGAARPTIAAAEAATVARCAFMHHLPTQKVAFCGLASGIREQIGLFRKSSGKKAAIFKVTSPASMMRSPQYAEKWSLR